MEVGRQETMLLVQVEEQLMLDVVAILYQTEFM